MKETSVVIALEGFSPTLQKSPHWAGEFFPVLSRNYWFSYKSLQSHCFSNEVAICFQKDTSPVSRWVFFSLEIVISFCWSKLCRFRLKVIFCWHSRCIFNHQTCGRFPFVSLSKAILGTELISTTFPSGQLRLALSTVASATKITLSFWAKVRGAFWIQLEHLIEDLCTPLLQGTDTAGARGRAPRVRASSEPSTKVRQNCSFPLKATIEG